VHPPTGCFDSPRLFEGRTYTTVLRGWTIHNILLFFLSAVKQTKNKTKKKKKETGSKTDQTHCSSWCIYCLNILANIWQITPHPRHEDPSATNHSNQKASFNGAGNLYSFFYRVSLSLLLGDKERGRVRSVNAGGTEVASLCSCVCCSCAIILYPTWWKLSFFLFSVQLPVSALHLSLKN